MHRCHWQNYHNSAKTFAITKTGTKLLNRYKLKVKKDGVHSSKYFFKNLKNSLWACKIVPPPHPPPPSPHRPPKIGLRGLLGLNALNCVLKCMLVSWNVPYLFICIEWTKHPQISMMQLFSGLKVINYCRSKALPQMYDKILNTTLQLLLE